jgi:membrane-bound metal-dependent hydrolase YbcI (DUF457 family)
MSDRKTHIVVGITAGVGYAAYQAKEQSMPNRLAEIAGGGLGGYFGALLPDVLEPGVSSWHRGTMHSWSAGASIVSLRDRLMEWEKLCREKAENCKAIPMVPVDPFTFVPAPVDPVSDLFAQLAEFFWRFLAGLANGLAAGYVSHLALDALTLRSIPLLASGF